MRALGYPRLVSMDNFRAPNFQLVADSLYWMVKRYDPDIHVSDNIESENDRVDFLTGVAAVSATVGGWVGGWWFHDRKWDSGKPAPYQK